MDNLPGLFYKHGPFMKNVSMLSRHIFGAVRQHNKHEKGCVSEKMAYLRSTSNSAWVKSWTSSRVMLWMGTPWYPLPFRLW